MADFSPQARQTSRGQHPDLTDSGDLRADVYLSTEERDFWRRWQDPASRQQILNQMAASQRQEPNVVQLLVQGKSYGDGSNPYRGMQAYRAAIEEARGINAAINGATTHIDDRDIENMSTAEYEKYFDPDQGGQPRPGRGRELHQPRHQAGRRHLAMTPAEGLVRPGPGGPNSQPMAAILSSAPPLEPPTLPPLATDTTLQPSPKDQAPPFTLAEPTPPWWETR